MGCGVTRILNAIERGFAKIVRADIASSSMPKRPRRKQQLALPGVNPPRKPRKPRIKEAWKYDPVIKGGFEVFPDGRVGLWAPVRLRTPQESDLQHHWQKRDWNEIVAGIVNPLIHAHLKKIDPNAVDEVWFVQLSPKKLFDGDNLNGACKHIQDCLSRYFGRDDASWRAGAIRWRHMWMKHSAYGCLVLLHGKADGGRYDRVKDGFVTIQRENGEALTINVRDELRDTE